MTAMLKLAKLPERTSVKLTPDLHVALSDYAAVYAETYGQTERIEYLIPPMLASFLDSDKSCVRRSKSG
jgi:hypothetical protein